MMQSGYDRGGGTVSADLVVAGPIIVMVKLVTRTRII